MHKACAFLTAAFLAWATTPCHAGDNAQQSVLPAATTLSNGAAQEKLPQPTATFRNSSAGRIAGAEPPHTHSRRSRSARLLQQRL